MMKLKTIKPRNPLHDHPLLRKGGAHGRTKKAERRREKQALRKAWVSLSACLVLSEAYALQHRIFERILGIASAENSAGDSGSAAEMS